MVLNHSTGDIAEVYDRYDYLAEKAIALVRWAEELKALVDANSTPETSSDEELPPKP
jgi:hypothetical protein